MLIIPIKILQIPNVWTTSAGAPIEVRDAITLNSDLFSKELLLDTNMHQNAERIPERIVHAKGGGAYGYFEVTNDVSKYTSADVFNGIGKKTTVAVRVSTGSQNLGGNELTRELKGFVVKFYTNEGNLDLLCLQVAAFVYRDPILFVPFVRSFNRNARTNLFDANARLDLLTKRPDSMLAFLILNSDYGIPDGYRKMDAFPIHTYEISNKHGDRYYVKFNFRSEQGLANLTSTQARALDDPDYYNRDLFNAIEIKNYPSWRLEMDVMTIDDIKNINYNPFEVTRLWKKGDYQTVTIGRLTLNRNPDNWFRLVEQSAFNPANLVPGIPGPLDTVFRARRLFYRDTQNRRLGINHNKISVNMPKYAKTYLRDGLPPIKDNMKDAPNYFPNSFNGPQAYVDENRPKTKLFVLESNAADLQPASDFYNEYVIDEAHRQRLASNIVEFSNNGYPHLIKRLIRVLTLVDADLGRRVKEGLIAANAAGLIRTVLPDDMKGRH